MLRSVENNTALKRNCLEDGPDPATASMINTIAIQRGWGRTYFAADRHGEETTETYVNKKRKLVLTVDYRDATAIYAELNGDPIPLADLLKVLVK